MHWPLCVHAQTCSELVNNTTQDDDSYDSLLTTLQGLVASVLTKHFPKSKPDGLVEGSVDGSMLGVVVSLKRSCRLHMAIA